MRDGAVATRPRPTRATVYVAATALAAAAVAAFVLAWLVPRAAPMAFLGTFLFLAGFFFLERQAVLLVWRQERITTALTEAAVLLGLLWLPGAYLVPAVAVSRAAIGIATRRAFVKSAFNVAAGVLSVGAAWGVFSAADAAGLPRLASAILGTVAYSVAAELLVSGLFGLLERTFFLDVYRRRFLRPNVLAMTYGITAALVLHALYSLHLFAVLAAAPFLFLIHRYAAYEARADREIGLYQRLARESQALVGCDRRDVIAERALALCLDGLGARHVTLRLENGASWQRPEEDPGTPPWITTPILGREGRHLGEFSVWRRPGRRADLAHDEALLRIIASQTGHALESAEALVEVARQRDVVARQEKLSALGSLVAGVAHEVNNPLTYLNGNVELALLDLEEIEQRQAKDPRPVDLAETRHLLTTALDGARRIGEIVKALRAVARARGDADRERVPMNKIAQNVYELMRIGVPERVRLECETDPQDPAVLGYSSELHQLALNLAKNAVEATVEKGGAVVVSVTCTADKVELRVADEGEGMTEDTRRRLFTPFFTTKGAAGTGLGLSIVSSIVKEHSGEITVDSELGRGTTFRVVLPRV